MNANNDIVYCCLRLGPLHQFHAGCSRSLVGYNDRLHNTPPFLLISKQALNEVMLPYTIVFDLVSARL
jgi:hypothetical protein